MTDWVKRHYAWRQRANRYAPQVMAHIFALRGQHYVGCGFHYSLEKRAGTLLARLNDFETPLDFATTIIDQIAVTELLRDLNQARRSARRFSSAPPAPQCPADTAPPAS